VKPLYIAETDDLGTLVQPLTMQKVEGSNPFSRSPEDPALAGLSQSGRYLSIGEFRQRQFRVRRF